MPASMGRRVAEPAGAAIPPEAEMNEAAPPPAGDHLQYAPFSTAAGQPVPLGTAQRRAKPHCLLRSNGQRPPTNPDGDNTMSFTNQLALAFTVAALATLTMFGLTPLVQDLIQILNANVIVSAAVGLPVLTTISLLIALFALQR